jgi:hypothetical protein
VVNWWVLAPASHTPFEASFQGARPWQFRYAWKDLMKMHSWILIDLNTI